MHEQTREVVRALREGGGAEKGGVEACVWIVRVEEEEEGNVDG
jgi:hypothetical protein